MRNFKSKLTGRTYKLGNPYIAAKEFEFCMFQFLIGWCLMLGCILAITIWG